MTARRQRSNYVCLSCTLERNFASKLSQNEYAIFCIFGSCKRLSRALLGPAGAGNGKMSAS